MKTKKDVLKKFNYLLSLVVISSFILFASCEKEDESNIGTAPEEVLDEAFAADIFDEVIEIADEAIYSEDDVTTKSLKIPGRNFLRLGECVTIIKTVSGDTIITTVDFGEENCLCNDGKERRGEIIIKRVGAYWDGGVEVTITFEDYFVNDNQVLGYKYVTGFINEDGNREHQIVVDGQIILADNEGTITWYAERTRIVVEGSDTRDKFDDVIEITGFSYGTCANGNTFSTEILTPLVKKHELGCQKYIVSGTMQIIKNEEIEILIDFGDGTCDNLVEITIDGVTTIVEITRRRRLF